MIQLHCVRSRFMQVLTESTSRPTLSISLVFFMLLGLYSCAAPRRHTIFLQYLQREQKSDFLPLTVGLAPFQDLRSSPQLVGKRIRSDGKEEQILLGTPYPSEELSMIMRRFLHDRGIRIVDLLSWTPDPNNLRDLPEEIQVAILCQIDALDVSARSSVFKTDVQYRVMITAHMGMKERGEVVSRTIEVSPRKTLLGFRSQDIERDLNEALADALGRLFEGVLSQPPKAK